MIGDTIIIYSYSSVFGPRLPTIYYYFLDYIRVLYCILLQKKKKKCSTNSIKMHNTIIGN